MIYINSADSWDTRSPPPVPNILGNSNAADELFIESRRLVF